MIATCFHRRWHHRMLYILTVQPHSNVEGQILQEVQEGWTRQRCRRVQQQRMPSTPPGLGPFLQRQHLPESQTKPVVRDTPLINRIRLWSKMLYRGRSTSPPNCVTANCHRCVNCHFFSVLENGKKIIYEVLATGKTVRPPLARSTDPMSQHRNRIHKEQYALAVAASSYSIVSQRQRGSVLGVGFSIDRHCTRNASRCIVFLKVRCTNKEL